MAVHRFITFSDTNRRLIVLLAVGHLLWGGAVFGLWSAGRLIESSAPWWSGGFLVLQLFAAAQLLLPVLLMEAEKRSRWFYLFWGMVLALAIWLSGQLLATGAWQVPLSALKSGLLLLAATVTGAALAAFVRRPWEIVPVCLVMSLADVASWAYGPTGGFAREIRQFYLAPDGPPPSVDLILVKLAFPGTVGLVPVFGLSDWIMVAFFAVVAHRHALNDNLAGPPAGILMRRRAIGRYLPVPVAALCGAVLLAQTSGMFLPALPLIALAMLIWYAGGLLLRRVLRAGKR